MIKKSIFLHLLVFFLLPGFTGAGFCAKIVPLPGLNKGETIAIDDNQIYITEGPTVYIYSLKDMKLIKTFGRKGEGPAEFKIHPYRGLRVHVKADYLIVDSYGRLSYFSKDGVFKCETRTVPSMGKYVSLGNGFVGLGFAQQDRINYFTFTLFNPNFKEKKELYRVKHPYQRMKPYNPLEATRMPPYDTYDNKLYVKGKGCTILVFDHTGKPLDPVRFTCERVKLTEERKNYYITWYKTDPKFKSIYQKDKELIRFPEYFPDIRDFIISDGKIYVLTYRTKGGKNELLVLGLNGKRIHQAFVTLKEENAFRLFPYAVKGGVLYQVFENEEDERWELQIQQISS